MRVERRKRLPNWAIGLILVVIVGVLSIYAFTKSLPWADKYTVEAVFTNAGNVRPASPVRIAGVNVGKVTSVEHLAPDDPALTAQADGAGTPEDAVPSTATVVTMELDESALPLHTDATMKLRPRLFLEGNLFVDLKPGSPNAPEADDGHVFPAGQTAVAVQLDQVLTTLQSDVRTDLQILLDQFGNALDKYGGSEGLRELFRSSPGAFRYTSQVNEALLGQEPHDLSDLIVNLDSTVEALGRNEGALQDLVTNLRIVLGSFAAESAALERGHRRAAARPRGGRAGARQPEPRLPRRPRVRARGAAGRAFDAGDAGRRDPVPAPAPRPGLRGRAARPDRGPAAGDPGPRAPVAADDPADEPVPRRQQLLQRGDHPVDQRHGQRPRDARPPAASSRSSRTARSGSPARAGPATPTVPTSACSPAAGPTRWCFPDPVVGLTDPLVGVTPLPILGAAAGDRLVGEDAVPSRRRLRDPGSAEPQLGPGRLHRPARRRRRRPRRI